jgi:hypothetical protein
VERGVHVHWQRAIGQGLPLDRWFASLDSPKFTCSFAQVERVDGRWWLILFPKWSIQHHSELRTQKISYRSAVTAKRHLEAWAAAHGPAITRRWSLRSDNIQPTI